jgi:hypothetical protein
MAKFVQKLYDEIRLYINQGQSQYFSPNEVMTALNRAQIDKYRAEFKLFEESQKITDAMRNFKTTADLEITAQKLFTLPTNYFNVVNISALTPDPLSTEEVPLEDLEYSGKIYTDGEWLGAKESELLPPEIEHLKARIINGSVQVLPKTVTKIRLYYLKKPVDCFYDYQIVNNQITYVELSSIDTEYPETEHTDLILRSMKYLGITMKSEIDMKSEQIIHGTN